MMETGNKLPKAESSNATNMGSGECKMDITTAQMVLFSPTGTTKKIANAIAHGLNVAHIDCFDLTLPGADTQKPQVKHDVLTIIGCPVYAGRIPAIAASRFREIRGGGAPAIIVVVYGNRAYEDALLELQDIALGAGFKPVAGGAFIGEHSYSTQATPIAAGRPDAEDIHKAKAFGGMIRDKMKSIALSDQINMLQVPGNFPYKELRLLQGISPSTYEPACTRCGKCVSVCPAAAINTDFASSTNANLCIRCCACVNTCAASARKMDDARILQVAEQLSASCKLRKEPETYL